MSYFFIKEDGTNAKIFLNSLQSLVNTGKITSAILLFNPPWDP